MKLHKLVEPARLREIRERWLGLNARRREALLEPGGRTSPRFRGLVETSLELAGSAVVLELGDETVRGHIADAVDAARNWLTAETGSATRGPQTTLVDAVVDASDDFTFETTKLDAEEAFFADVRAKKCWLVEDDAGARTACKEANSIALLALIEGKPSIFHGALADVVRAHQRAFKREPTRTDGVFTLDGLALCRMARTYGIEVEEQTYLPVRFLAPGSLRRYG